MIDAATYRLHEKLARQDIGSWRIEQMHKPVTFERFGFPVRLDGIRELFCILDTMQEGRFLPFQAERGGLTEEELAEFERVLERYIEFCQATFHVDRVNVPFSTFMAHFVLYKKILGFNPNARSILEIGPGCGYLSFFLENHDILENYSQIETTESFYVLQSLVNTYLFRQRFKEFACDNAAKASPGPLPTTRDEFEPPAPLALPPSKAVCHHYPWWRLGDLPGEAFDIITSNANFNEMTEAALKQYVLLMRRSLKSEGALIVQCFGGGALPIQTVLHSLYEQGFAAAMLVLNTGAVDLGQGRRFVLPNAVFVKASHPLYQALTAQPLADPRFDPSLPFVREMYMPSPDGRRVVGREEILERLSSRL